MTNKFTLCRSILQYDRWLEMWLHSSENSYYYCLTLGFCQQQLSWEKCYSFSNSGQTNITYTVCMKSFTLARDTSTLGQQFCMGIINVRGSVVGCYLEWGWQGWSHWVPLWVNCCLQHRNGLSGNSAWQKKRERLHFIAISREFYKLLWLIHSVMWLFVSPDPLCTGHLFNCAFVYVNFLFFSLISNLLLLTLLLLWGGPLLWCSH